MTLATPVTIVADDREAHSGVIAALEGIEGVALTMRRLALGDYQLDRRLLVERKTLADFAASLVDGRLFAQMTRLAASALRGILILEGSGSDLAACGVRREALQGALITVSLILGLPLLRARDPQESARLMVYAARQSASFAGGVLQRPGYRPRGKHRRQLFILQGLPGVGRERAARLLTRFGSIAAVIAASREELAAVEGIGTGTADKIRSMVSEAAAVYGEPAGIPGANRKRSSAPCEGR